MTNIKKGRVNAWNGNCINTLRKGEREKATLQSISMFYIYGWGDDNLREKNLK